MKNILDFRSFKLNENQDMQLAQRKAQIQKQIADLQKQMIEIDQQILNSQKQQLAQPNAAPLPMQNESMMVGEDGSIEDDFNEAPDGNDQPTPERHVIDYGFDDGVFWIGFTENIADDLNVEEDEFLMFLEEWAYNEYGSEELKSYNQPEESEEYGRVDKFDAKFFFNEIDRSTQMEAIQAFLKTKQ